MSEQLPSNQLLDPNICGDDGPISPEDCALWLDRKYRRHGELEDRAAAMWLRELVARLARLQRLADAAFPRSADETKGGPTIDHDLYDGNGREKL